MLNIASKNSSGIINLLVLLYAIVLPLGHAIANIAMGIISVFFVFDLIINKNKRTSLWKDNGLILVAFCSLFLLYLFGLFYSENLHEGVEAVIRKAPLLVFSVTLLYFKSQITKRTINNTIKGFSISIILVCLVSLFLSVYNCYDPTRLEVLQYCITDSRLAESFISYHKLYLSLYVSIGVFFMWYSLLIEKQKFWYVSIGVGSVLFLILFQFLLGGRTSVAISIILSIVFPVIFWVKRKNYYRIVIYSILVLSIITGNIVFNTPFQGKVKEAINYNNAYNLNKKWGGASVRMLIWKYSYEVVKKNPLLGVGTGDTKEELEKSYLNCKESAALKGQHYNTHNDMLQIIVTVGFLGLLIFLLATAYLISFSIKANNWVHIVFVSIILLTGLTESLFERDMGIRIFAFYYVLLFLNNKNENTPSS